MKPESELIHGIEVQTQSEIDSLSAQLEKIERDRSAAADREIEDARRDIERRTEDQHKRVDKAARAVLATERHKIELETSNRFFDQVLQESARRLRELSADKRYGEILKRWIVEAAVGLAADEAIVTVSPEERSLCEEVIKDAEREARRIIGREVRLKLGQTDARGDLGAVLTAASGRTGFNNQVHTRMLRKETEVRRIIYDELSRAVRHSASEPTQPRENEHNDG